MRFTHLFLLSLVCLTLPGVAQDPEFTLYLGDAPFDPAVSAPRADSPWNRASSGETDLHLVQFVGPTRPDWLQRLRAAGLTPVQYLHPYTYVVWGNLDTLQGLDAAFVRWTGPFLPAYKVLPALRGADTTPRPYRMLAYRGLTEDRLRAGLRAAGARAVKRAVVDGRFYMFTFLLAPARLADVAALPGVYTVQPQPTDGGDRAEMACQLVAGQLVDGLIVPGYADWLNDIGLDGSGVIIASVDSGMDESHVDLAAGVLPCTGTTCGGATASNHGTHTAGIAAGRATSGTVDGQGFLRGQGAAPGAQLVEQVYGATISEPGGMLLLMSESYRNGAHLSTNSWGVSGSAQGYDMDTLQVDIGVRDADPQEAGNQAFSYILAVANGLGGTSSQGTPDEAKNVFRVGSTWLRGIEGSQSTLIGSVSDNSAHGPALDGRFLPDLTAPGKFVDSTALAGTYQLRSGTSMATPLVAGGAALFYQYYRGLPHNPGGFDPSPAMVKAALMAPATDLEGGEDADEQPLGHRFDNKQGWGRLNIAAVLDPVEPVAYMDKPVLLTATGQTWSQDVFVADNSKPVKIMLVYTDAPGHGLGGIQPAWNNNLNLEVDYNGQTYLGNRLGASGWSETGGVADAINNVEGVLIGPTAPTTDLTIRVRAANINSDGVPGNGSGADQDFAVVCYNCVQEDDYLLAVDNTQRTVCAGTDAVFTLNVGSLGTFADPVTLGTTGLPGAAGVAFSVNPLTPPAATVLTLSNTGALATGNYPFTLTASGGGIDHTLNLVLRVEQSVPIGPTLSAPLNGATGQSQSPLFRWQALPGANNYYLELATDAAFTDVVLTHTQTGTEYDTLTRLAYEGIYYWRVRADNPCGIGAWSTVFQLEVEEGPPILLVDDDDNLPDVLDLYTGPLGFYGITYDLWDVSIHQAEPDAAVLAQYQAVFWFSGNAYNEVTTGPPLAGPGEAGETALGTYLDGGGKLFLTAQHYLLDRGGSPFAATPFMTNHLGLASTTLNLGGETVQGNGPFVGIGPWEMSTSFVLRPDIVHPGPDTAAVFTYTGSGDNAALFKDNGTYRSLFLPWPFDALSEGQRLILIDRVVDALGIHTGPCANEDDFEGKLPFWPNEENATSLIQCLNSFLMP